jgi:hypothetical protein
MMLQVSTVQAPGGLAEAKYGIGVSFKPDEKKYLEVLKLAVSPEPLQRIHLTFMCVGPI